MRYILIILVFLSVGGKAQMVIKAHANYRPYALPAVNLLLDDYPNAAAAYSLRKLDKDYAGSAIRVRRSNDNAESDIGFTSSGDLDTAALKTFVGANSGFVATWYDQSGNARNATQSTQAYQPRIVLTGVIHRDGGKPCLVIYNDLVSVGTASLYAITHSVQVGKVNSQTNINYILGGSSHGIFWNGSFTGVNGLGAFDGTNLRSISNEDLNRHLGFFSIRSSKLFVARDGGTETDAGSFASSINVDRVGGRFLLGLGFSGNIQEIISWNSDQSSNRTGIENNINTHYGIY